MGLEIRTKLTKSFFVRRRCFPGDARLLHDTQGTFAFLSAHLAVVWHAGLNWITLNEDIARPGGMLRAVLGWIGTSVALIGMMWIVNHHVRKHGRLSGGGRGC